MIDKKQYVIHRDKNIDLDEDLTDFEKKTLKSTLKRHKKSLTELGKC